MGVAEEGITLSLSLSLWLQRFSTLFFSPRSILRTQPTKISIYIVRTLCQGLYFAGHDPFATHSERFPDPPFRVAHSHRLGTSDPTPFFVRERERRRKRGGKKARRRENRVGRKETTVFLPINLANLTAAFRKPSFPTSSSLPKEECGRRKISNSWNCFSWSPFFSL